MSTREDPFDVLILDESPDRSDQPSCQPLVSVPAGALSGAATARLEGFAVDDQPLIAGVPELPGEIVPARTTVPLQQRQIGSSVVVLFEHGDARRPIIVGVLQDQPTSPEQARTVRIASVDVDDDRLVLSAEREIVLRCGQASITLTRAGKILIHGAYISSRSSGVSRIKGGSVQIN